jgi:DNA replication licensing factor MCM3
MNNSFPTTDMNGNPLQTEFGLCQYKSVQFITLQEIPERAPTGQLPRSIDVVLEGDLVDTIKPGDRVETVGIFKTIANKSSTNLGLFKTVIIANNVYTLQNELAAPTLSGADI